MDPVRAAAQFGLPKFNMDSIASTITKSSPQNLADALTQKSPNDMAKDVIQEATAKAIQETGQAAASQVLTKATEAATEAATQASEVAKTIKEVAESRANATAVQVTVTEAPKVTVPATSVAADDHEIVPTKKVVDAVNRALNDTNAQKAAEAIQKAIPNSLPEALDLLDLKKAQQGLQEALQNKDHVETVRNAGQDVASVLKLPSVSQLTDILGSHKGVSGTIQKAQPVAQGVAEVLAKDPEKIQRIIEGNVPKVVETIRKTDPKKVQEMIDEADPHKIKEVINVVERAEWWGSHWQWPLLGMLGAGAVVAGGWQVLKKRDARSPSLLVDAEIGAWMNNGRNSRSRVTPQADEALFRQF